MHIENFIIMALQNAHAFRCLSYLCKLFNFSVKVCFNLFSGILLGIISLVLIWSCAGVDLAVAIVSNTITLCHMYTDKDTSSC